MKTVVRIYYTLAELKERFPNTFKRVIAKLSREESEYWQPSGDFYFSPGPDAERDAFRIALENKAPRVFASYDEYKQADYPTGAYSPGHAFFQFSEHRIYFDVDNRHYRAACPDLRPANVYAFMAYLRIPPRLWNLLNVKVEFSEIYGKNALLFSVNSTGEEIFFDGKPITDRKIRRLEKIFETAESIFDELLLTANRRISEDFYYAVSEEGIADLSACNDWHFDEYGEFLRGDA